MRHFRTSKGALGPSPDAPAQPLGAARKVLALFSFVSAALVLGGCQMLFGDFEELPAEQPVLVCKNNSGVIFNDLDGTIYKECDTAKGEQCISTGSSAVCAQCKIGDTECDGEIGAIKFRECVDGVWEVVEACGAEQRCDSDPNLGCVDCKFGERRCVDAPEVIEQECKDNQWVLRDTCDPFDGLPPACFNAPVSDPQDSRLGRCRTCVEEEWACVAFEDAVGSGQCKDGTRPAKVCPLGCDAVTKQCK